METAAGTAGAAGTDLRAAQDRGATAVAATAEVQAPAHLLREDDEDIHERPRIGGCPMGV